MFIGIRDILFAKGRFALICSVIAMLTFMVVMLSALTNGLQNQSISAVTRLPGHALVLEDPGSGQKPSLTQSDLQPRAVGDVTGHDGSTTARLGVSTTKITADGTSASISVFGADSGLAPEPATGTLPGDGGILLGAPLADQLGVGVGDTVHVGPSALRVTGIGPAGDYAHTPVGYTTIDTWRGLAHGAGPSAVVVLDGTLGQAPSGTMVLPMSQVTDAVPGYGSEHGSLLAMQGMLLAVSALVVGAFFAVWTVQRRHDLAVLRAIGADRGYLLRDGGGQAALVLLAGEGVGALLGVGLALLASGIVPIAVTASGVLLPVVAMAVLGAAGALLSVRGVTRVDPMVALNR